VTIACWNTRFLTGIGIIDAQHESLFQAVNVLADAVKADNASPRVRKALEELVQLSLDHFQTEEQFMHESGYPRLATHLEEHQELIVKLEDLKTKHKQGGLVSADVTFFFADWFAHHINEVDMGNGTTPAWSPEA